MTINYDEESDSLQEQVTELTQKSEEQNYIIRGKLAEKEKEMEEMQDKIKLLEDNTHSLFQMIAENYPDRHITKIIDKKTGEAETRVYGTNKDYLEAMQKIKKTGKWD